ncbi:hypothetical protein NG798_25230 [Ancylothrix sp. C2]|uniref:hypothetical protein n=1 Tax=Ancylothrix sp. D3o TaxID=2953691 RepID=UPI0021BB9277|nr:hypothetical protein [Ancylothrix sp. D3o]MCT7953105.1 hypothetical protein [Ancylothrix sp. D3o]
MFAFRWMVENRRMLGGRWNSAWTVDRVGQADVWASADIEKLVDLEKLVGVERSVELKPALPLAS